MVCRFRWRLLTCVLLFCVAGAQARQRAADKKPVPPAKGNYVIYPTDSLNFRILGESETDINLRVSADGMAAFPYIGSVKLAGLAIQDARQMLYELYDRDYFVNPQISLFVVRYAERRVQVLGQVHRPGFVLIPPEEDLSLVQAITASGGFTRLANQQSVQLKRLGEDGAMRVYKISASEIIRNPESNDWQLFEGDTIFVPERRL